MTSEPNAGGADQRRLNPAIAALLTLVGDGMGFFYVGRTRLATVVAVVATLLPVAAFVALAVHALTTGSTQALNPIVGGGAIGVDIVAWAITLVVAVWAGVVAARRRTAPRKGRGRLWGYFAIWLLPMIAALLIGLTIRFLWLQPFRIPSGDMQPTLGVQTLVLANRAAYGYGRYSFAPFETLVPAERLTPRAPARGDVVVFRATSDPSRDFVKRVIGLPGDRVQMLAGVVFINGERVRRDALDAVQFSDDDGYRITVSAYRETLPNGVAYVTLDRQPDAPFDTTQPFDVPADRMFVLGDDRDNSQDSRAAEFGLVPIANLIGRIDASTPSEAR